MNIKYFLMVITLCTLFSFPGFLAQAITVDPKTLDPANPGLTLDGQRLMLKPPWIDKPARIPHGGWRATHNVLVICIRFSDVASSFTAGSFDNMVFGPWTPYSMNDYFNEVSYGNLQLTGLTVGWYVAANTRAHYGNAQQGWGAYPQNAAALVEEAVDAAETAGVDFSQYDNDGDGVAESIFVVHCGEGHETSLDTNDIHSHLSSISAMGGTARSYDGKTIDTYLCVPELQASGPAVHAKIGVYCHEFGHMLGLPDLNDTGVVCGPPMNTLSSGIGVWGLMGYGGWGGTVADPEQPTHLCAWSKIRLGWLTPTVVASAATGQLLSRIEDNATALKIGMNWRGTEYLLVSHRDNSYGFDSNLPGGGVLIWHIDEEVTTGNDCEDAPYCTSSSHYLVSLEQPDGNFDLDCSAFTPYGDSGDVYPYSTVDQFTASTTPSSNRHDGSASGVSITNIAASASDMQIDIQPGDLWEYLVYDDGSMDGGWSSVDGYGFAVRMTPGTYPFDLKGIHIHQNTGNCQYQIWSDSGGTPGSPLSSVLNSSGATGYSWDYEDVSTLNIQIASGDFWVLYIIYNASTIGADTNSAWNGRTMTYYLGTFYTDSGAYGNYGLRATGFGATSTDTIACDYTITPLVGTVAFVTTHRVELFNLAASTRRIAAGIQVIVASGTSYNPWKFGFVNVAAASSFVTQWNTNIPALGTVIGNNTFSLYAEDVTPPPYNQSPYPPSGDTCTKTNVVVANAP